MDMQGAGETCTTREPKLNVAQDYIVSDSYIRFDGNSS